MSATPKLDRQAARVAAEQAWRDAVGAVGAGKPRTFLIDRIREYGEARGRQYLAEVNAELAEECKALAGAIVANFPGLPSAGGHVIRSPELIERLNREYAAPRKQATAWDL